MRKCVLHKMGLLLVICAVLVPITANADRLLPDGTYLSDNVNAPTVPEPATMLLLGLGGGLLGLGKFRKKD